MIKLTRYIIQFDPRMRGWIAFRQVQERVSRVKNRVIEKVPLTTPKKDAYLATRALLRVLDNQRKEANNAAHGHGVLDASNTAG